MKRRSILMGLGLGVGGASAPLWLTRSFGLDRADDCDLETDAIDAIDAIDATDMIDIDVIEADPPASQPPASPSPSATHRPRLVLVIPGERDERYYRGHAFGELLHHGDDLTLARLALFDVLCATPAEIEKMTGKPLKGEPWLVVIDRTGPKLVVSPLTDAQLDLETARANSLEDAKIDARIARLSALIATAAAPALIERLAAAETVPPNLAGELDMVLQDHVAPRLELAATATATLLARIVATNPKDGAWRIARLRAAIEPRLAELTRDRLLRTRPPTGARWATSGGCGVRIEGHTERHAIGCGMGHVPERSRRFLAWLGDYERGF